MITTTPSSGSAEVGGSAGAGEPEAAIRRWLAGGEPLLRLPAATPVDRVMVALGQEGVDPRLVELDGITEKGDLLEVLHRALDGGPWFGFNWDALEELLHGPEEGGAPRVLLCRAFEPFAARAPDHAGILLDIVRSVAGRTDQTLRGLILIG